MPYEERFTKNLNAVLQRVNVEGDRLVSVKFDKRYVLVSFEPGPGHTGRRKNMAISRKRAGCTKYGILCELIETGFIWQCYPRVA